MTPEKSQPIAFFLLFLDGGGAERVVVTLANTLVDLANRPIHVVLAERKGPLLHELRPEVKIVDLCSGNELKAIFTLSKYLRKHSPAILMSSMKNVNVLAIIASLIARRPSRLVIREANVLLCSQEKYLQRIRTKILVYLMRGLYRFADAIIINSEATKLSLEQQNIKLPEAYVISNPIEIKRTSKENCKCNFPTPYICSVGRLKNQKGHETLLEAFALLPEKDLHLVILGEGELRHDLESRAASLQISNRVHMPGFIKNPFSILERAEAFVLASRWEGFGNVIVEALSLGLPVVCTDCPGAPRFILENGKHGHLVPVDQPQALADAIMQALTAPAGTPASRKARAADFDAEKICKEYLYKVLIPSSSKKEGD